VTIISKPPIIVLTAMSELDAMKKSAALGIAECMLKSRFSLKQLIERVTFHLAEKQAVAA